MTKSDAGVETLELNFALVSEVKPPFRVSRDELASLTTLVLEAEAARGQWEITVALVDDARLQGLHREFMGIDEPTDIMTFPATAAGSEVQGGELVISVDHARTQAGAWGHSPSDEVRLSGRPRSVASARLARRNRRRASTDARSAAGALRSVAGGEWRGPLVLGQCPAQHVGRVEGGSALNFLIGCANRERLRDGRWPVNRYSNRPLEQSLLSGLAGGGYADARRQCRTVVWLAGLTTLRPRRGLDRG